MEQCVLFICLSILYILLLSVFTVASLLWWVMNTGCRVVNTGTWRSFLADNEIGSTDKSQMTKRMCMQRSTERMQRSTLCRWLLQQRFCEFCCVTFFTCQVVSLFLGCHNSGCIRHRECFSLSACLSPGAVKEWGERNRNCALLMVGEG